MNEKILEQYGISFQEGLDRFCGDNELYERMLHLFLEDQSYNKCKEAFAKKDYHELFEAAHEMKGVSGNLDLKNLYEASCELVELLRNGEYDSKRIKVSFIKFEEAYQKTKEGLELAFTD
jgi:HPt (histidine-containing phosphotransfer) domain-containing protein